MSAPMSATTQERRRAIREILEEEAVASQVELLARLAERGFQATQPLLSRDLRALSVAKRDGVYRLSERVTRLEMLAPLLRGARPAGQHLVVIACEPGAASAVARALEVEGLAGLVGTVAGDDTVFAAVEGKAAGDRLRERVLEIVE